MFNKYVNNLYALFSFSVLLLSVFLFPNSTFALPSYSISLSTSSPDITQDIKVSPVSKTIIIPQTVTINSNNPHGIKLFISSKDDKLVPTKTNNTSPSEPVGPVTPYIPSGYTAPMGNSNTPISPVPGDISNPSTLNMNSFGFALPNESDNPLSSNFSNNNIYTSNDKNLKNTAKFSKLTNKHNPIEIYQNKSTTTNKQLTVYYGTKINSVIDKGTYTLDILYTLIPNLAGTNTTPGQNNQEVLTIEESDNNTLELTPTKLTKAQGNETLIINTTINTNLNIFNEAINSKYILIEAKINNKPCTNIQVEQIASINGNEGNINQTQNTEKQLKLTCTTPPNTPGKYNLTLKIVQNHNPQDTTSNNNVNNTNNKVLLNINKKNAVEYIEVTDMQSFTPTMCKNMQEHEVKYVKDTRDNEIYTIAKLKDKKCWMTQNLRLKLSKNKTLTSNDTDILDSWTPKNDTAVLPSLNGAKSLFSEENGIIREAGSGYRPDDYMKYGNYYYTNIAHADSGYIQGGHNYGDRSICPKNWTLPNVSGPYNNSDFYHMAKYYKGEARIDNDDMFFIGNHNLIDELPNFNYPGYFISGYGGKSFNFLDEQGFYWGKNGMAGFSLHIGKDFIDPRGSGSMYDIAASIRCLVREPKDISEITYMQDMESGTCDKMVEHQTATLTDKRDGQQYTIAKLKDGKCWMTQNLRLKLSTSTALTSDNTDLNNTTSWTPTHTTEQFSTSGGKYSQGAGSKWGSDKKADKSGFRPDNYNTHGVYYSHGSATADSARNLDGNGNEAPDSICPKGWRLPKTTSHYSNSDFYHMAQHYKDSGMSWATYDNGNGGYWHNSSHNMTNIPIPNFQYSGLYSYSGSVRYIGSYGYWWASTIGSSSRAYLMLMYSSRIYPRDDGTRLVGFSVRCMSR